jgi:hypothetical protein
MLYHKQIDMVRDLPPLSGPLANLLKVAEIVAIHDPTLHLWFGEGVAAFVRGDVGALDIGLGLRARGRSLPPAVLARAARDEALRQAIDLFPGADPAEQTNARLTRLARYLKNFQTAVLPRLRSGARRPRSGLEAAALAAFDAIGDHGTAALGARQLLAVFRAREDLK